MRRLFVIVIILLLFLSIVFLSGIYLGNSSTDIRLHDTYFEVTNGRYYVIMAFILFCGGVIYFIAGRKKK